jgi:hypothetical protein
VVSTCPKWRPRRVTKKPPYMGEFLGATEVTCGDSYAIAFSKVWAASASRGSVSKHEDARMVSAAAHTSNNHCKVRRAASCRGEAAEDEAGRYPHLRWRVSARQVMIDGARYGVETGPFADENLNVLT